VSNAPPTVLDASALLAALNREPGGDTVAAALATGCVMSAVNFSEVVAKLREAGTPEPPIRERLGSLVAGGLEVVAFDESFAYVAGLLRPLTRAYGLSFGDRACLALGLIREGVVLTADRAWVSLEQVLGVRIRSIR
jgi:ribonuclease VapC